MQVSSLTPSSPGKSFQMPTFFSPDFHASPDAHQQSLCLNLRGYAVGLMARPSSKRSAVIMSQYRPLKGRQRPSCSICLSRAVTSAGPDTFARYLLESDFFKSAESAPTCAVSMDTRCRARCHCAPPAVGDSNNSPCRPVKA